MVPSTHDRSLGDEMSLRWGAKGTGQRRRFTLRNALSWFEPEAWLVFRHGCEVILEAVYEARLLFSNAGVNRDSTEV